MERVEDNGTDGDHGVRSCCSVEKVIGLIRRTWQRKVDCYDAMRAIEATGLEMKVGVE